MPASAAVSRVLLSPFAALSLHPSRVCPWGGFPVMRLSVSMCLCLSPLCVSLSPGIFSFFLVDFSTQGQDSRAPPLPISRLPRSFPPSPPRYVTMLEPFRLPRYPPPFSPLPLPLVVMIPSRESKFVGRSARSIHVQIHNYFKRLRGLLNQELTLWRYRNTCGYLVVTSFLVIYIHVTKSYYDYIFWWLS